MIKKMIISLVIMIVIAGLGYWGIVSLKSYNQNTSDENVINSVSANDYKVQKRNTEDKSLSNTTKNDAVNKEKHVKIKEIEATTGAVIKNTVDNLTLKKQDCGDKNDGISKKKISGDLSDNIGSEKQQTSSQNGDLGQRTEVITQHTTEAPVQSTTEALKYPSTERNVQQPTEENITEKSIETNNADTPKENHPEKKIESFQKQPEQSANILNTEPVTQEPVCDHRWVWATHTETVHHDAVYEDYLVCEEYDENIYETHVFCNNCGLDLTVNFGGSSSSEAADHMHNICGGCGYHSGRAVVGTIHHEAEYGTICTALAYDEYIEVNDYEYCSICGEKK